MPAPRAILDAAVEGAQVDFDTASRIESRYFTHLVTGQVAKNMIQAFFFDLQHITGGGSRPEGIGKTPITKIGVLGAGMMGAGIAYVSAKAGFDVVLKDVDIEAAKKGKGYSEKLEAKALERGKTTEEKSKALLARITPTADPADLKGVDFVVEAVFENQELKHKVFQEIEDIVEPNALLGSNTSTLPITGLATGVKRQEDFIGIHFFSPVDKMPLVEIIKGEKTSDEALARVFDYTLAIGKTPIVVNDSRGFFTSRVIGTFVNEALAMLGEGVEPASIEHAGSQAGYPAPPLQLSDELNLELMHKIAAATRKGVEDTGATYEPHPAEAVVEKMIEIGRPSRLKGAGFYEYTDGKRTGLWPGLRETFKSGASEPPLQDMIDRMLFAEALETQKCLDEGVLTSTADANIGSIMGIGFPPWTGGSAQFIVGYEGPAGRGKEAFVARAKELAATLRRPLQPAGVADQIARPERKSPRNNAVSGAFAIAHAHHCLVSCPACGTQLRADAKFCDECGAAVVTAGTTAEFKQVTVLFADVVRSMDIAVAVGTERLREIMSDLFDRSADVVNHYRGTLSQFTGDGVMAVFGAPLSLEDHAIRACLAALAIQSQVHDLAIGVRERDGIDLRLRVGLNSGEVIAGEVGSRVQSYTTVGRQVGMAQRMESAAPSVE